MVKNSATTTGIDIDFIHKKKEEFKMTKDIVKQKIEDLRKEITKHDKLYEQNKPIISDGEYDKLYTELVELERKYPEHYSSESPTQKIITETVTELQKVAHTVPMLSLDKTNTEDGIIKFANKLEQEILVEQKLDGLTIVLTYENGQLIDAVTRGNGFVGERVTHTVKTIKSLPRYIPCKEKIIVRGEIIIPYAEFKKANIDGKYSNPRNLASGTVRQLNSETAVDRGLDLIIYDLVTESEFVTDTDALEFLKQQGFKIIPYWLFSNSDKDVKKLTNFCFGYEDKRKELKYAIDGLVLKYNSLAVRSKLGHTAKAPRWGIAFKFKGLDAMTELRDVVWQVGRTGQITPVAVFDKIEIDGVKINRATLHNYQNILDKDIRIGDKIVVVRANDVIPSITQSIKEERDGSEEPVNIPVNCPECGASTEKERPFLYCTGLNCEPQLVERLIHFCKRDAMNIEGLGVSSLELLVKEGLLYNIVDIYKLHEHKKELAELEGFGKKKIENIITAVEDSKKNPLSNLLYGLGIPHLGKTNSPIITKYFKTMNNLINCTFSDLLTIEGIGEIIAESIIEFFKDGNNIKMIQELEILGLNMEEQDNAESKSETLDGKVFVITGTLSESRSDFKKKIEHFGGKITGSVSSKTDYLLLGVGAENSSKHKKASELGVKIVDEEEFNKLIKVK